MTRQFEVVFFNHQGGEVTMTVYIDATSPWHAEENARRELEARVLRPDLWSRIGLKLRDDGFYANGIAR